MHRIGHLDQLLTGELDRAKIGARVRVRSGLVLTLDVNQCIPRTARGQVGEVGKIMLADIFEGSQSIGLGASDHPHAHVIIEALGEIVGLVQQFKDKAVKAFFLSQAHAE